MKDSEVKIVKINPKELMETKNDIGFEFCNVKIEPEKVLNSPIFFLENTNEDKNKFLSNMPIPSDCALYAYEDIYKSNVEEFYKIGICDCRKRAGGNNLAYTDILIDRFLNTVKLNICAVFKNGLYAFINPYLYGIIYHNYFNYEPSEETIKLIYSALINNTPESGIIQASKIIVLFARELGNWYFNYINKILFEELYNKEKLCKKLADDCDIDYETIDEKQKYMFISSCLLELAKVDIHKDLEIIEVNAMNLVNDFYVEYLSGVSKKEDTK